MRDSDEFIKLFSLFLCVLCCLCKKNEEADQKKKKKNASFSLKGKALKRSKKEEERSFARVLFDIRVCLFSLSLTEEEEEEEEWRSSTTRASIRFIT